MERERGRRAGKERQVGDTWDSHCGRNVSLKRAIVNRSTHPVIHGDDLMSKYVAAGLVFTSLALLMPVDANAVARTDTRHPSMRRRVMACDLMARQGLTMAASASAIRTTRFTEVDLADTG
jgi:hypothetical protein